MLQATIKLLHHEHHKQLKVRQLQVPTDNDWLDLPCSYVSWKSDLVTASVVPAVICEVMHSDRAANSCVTDTLPLYPPDR